jgi:hypothetical protein
MPNRFLVVVRAGDQSLHPHWTRAPAARDWDLIVSYFGDDSHRFRFEGETRIDDKGLKWEGLHALLSRDERWRRYDYVWFPDDDLATDQATISAFFRHVVELRLALAQPALSWTSHVAHRVTVRHPSFRARWTDFIEIMAPCFERGLLEACLPTFAGTLSGWGLDRVWPHLLEPHTRRSAIIDAVEVTHTRPVGGPSYDRLRAAGVSAVDEARDLCRRYGIDHDRAPRVIAAVDNCGRVFDAANPADAAALQALLVSDWRAFRTTRQRQNTMVTGSASSTT